ncbi:hypothetical protein WJX72_000383 [[Myrmecia] bisecta]|uniref:DUF4485 domain-containing protein n=1 Tax=[Myrmecia] bisecta TaxID=41462 RepID=A0AAW1PE13_9CHLO
MYRASGQVALVSDTQHTWHRAFDEIKAGHALDSKYNKLAYEVERHCQLLQRPKQVRVKLWLHKLGEKMSNVTWKKNRNMYARLLLEQLRCGRLENPFHTNPPPGPLQMLPRWLLYPYCNARQPGMHMSAKCTCSCSGSPPRAAMVGQPGRRPPATELADASWQPSKLELEAQLGASKERQLELEWRLKQAEQRAADGSGGKKQALREDLDGIISKFEQRRSGWGSPRKTRHITEDVANEFGDFQRQTEALRKQMEGGSASAAVSDTPNLAAFASSLASTLPSSPVRSLFPDTSAVDTGPFTASGLGLGTGRGLHGPFGSELGTGGSSELPALSGSLFGQLGSSGGPSSSTTFGGFGSMFDALPSSSSGGVGAGSSRFADFGTTTTSGGLFGGGGGGSSEAPSSFLQQLQDFQKRTDALRDQIGSIGA